MGMVPFMKDIRNDPVQDKKTKARMLLALVAIGWTQFSQQDWSLLEEYWTTLQAKQQLSLKQKVEEKFAKTNPSILQNIASHFWAK